MRDRAPRLAAVALILAWGTPAAGRAQEAVRPVPVYDLETGVYSLGLEVDERVSSGRVSALDQPLSSAEAGPGATAEETTLAYFRAVAIGDEATWLRFHPPGAEPARVQQAGRILRQLAAAVGEQGWVRALREWRFGAFRVVVVEILGGDAAPSGLTAGVPSGRGQVLAVGLRRTEDGRFRRDDDWGEAQPVQQVFWYMARNLAQGLDGPRPDDHLNVRIPIEAAGGPGVALRLRGTWYAPDATFEPPRADQPGDAVRDFVRRAMAIAAEGSDEAFLALWRGERRQEASDILAAHPGRFGGLRQRVAERNAVRDVLTAELGDQRLHFYVQRADPTALRTVLIEQAGDGWSLSDELYANVGQLLRSPLVGRAVLDQLNRSATTDS